MFSVPELLKATAGRFISGKKDLKIKAISIDSRTIKPQEAFIAIKGNNFDGHDFIVEAIKKGASCIIREAELKISNALRRTHNAVHTTFIEVRDTIKALGNIANFQRNKFALPVIAVTGSNGKTTTKEMLAWVLSLKYKVLKNEGTKNNQIGLPLTLLRLNSSYDMAVVELGTNHPGEIEYLTRIASPNIGIIINIGPSHLEYLGDLKGVFREKYTLIENLKKPYLGILSADDSLLKEYALKQAKKPFILSFGIQGHCDFCGSDINMKFAQVNPVRDTTNSSNNKIVSNGVNFLVNKKHKFSLKTPGCFNIYNALATIAVARVFGLEYNDIRMRLGDFDFPTSRLKLTEFKEIKFIDDTCNSNPLSLKEALGMLANFSCKGRKIFVMGDMLELGRQKELFHYQAGKDVAKVCDIFITVGELSGLSAEAARKNRFEGLSNNSSKQPIIGQPLDSKNIFRCASVREAGEILFNRISPKKDDIVLIKGSRAMRMEEIFKT